MMEVLVNIAELVAAANNMDQALTTYNEAIDAVKAAANDLASKWEGDGQVAFVNDQEQAYTWYNSLCEVVREMIAEARRVAERYRDHVNNLKSQMG